MIEAGETVPRGGPPTGKGGTEARGRGRQKPASRIKNPRWLKPLVFLAALAPLAWVTYAFLSDVLGSTRLLGSEPIKASEHFTGKWALRFLLLSLAITPAVKVLRIGWLVTYRRLFGLFAFTYALVHLCIYFGLDIELDWSNLVEDVLDRIYITLGMLALLLMVPLAITSTKGWIRRLGNQRWRALHRLVYVIVVLGLIHFFMAVKQDIREPLVFAAIATLLLGYRLVTAWRQRNQSNTRSGNATAV